MKRSKHAGELAKDTALGEILDSKEVNTLGSCNYDDVKKFWEATSESLLQVDSEKPLIVLLNKTKDSIKGSIFWRAEMHALAREPPKASITLVTFDKDMPCIYLVQEMERKIEDISKPFTAAKEGWQNRKAPLFCQPSLDDAEQREFPAPYASKKGLVSRNFTAKALKMLGYNTTWMQKKGFTAEELKEGGFRGVDLVRAGFQEEDLTKSGFSIEDLAPTFVVVGKTGEGKSSLLSWVSSSLTIFEANGGQSSVTADVSKKTLPWFGSGESVTMVDTPGFGDSKGRDLEFLQQMALAFRNLKVIDRLVWVLNSEDVRASEGRQKVMTIFRALFGKRLWSHLDIVLTHFKWETGRKVKRNPSNYNEPRLQRLRDGWIQVIKDIEKQFTRDDVDLNNLKAFGVELPQDELEMALLNDSLTVRGLCFEVEEDADCCQSSLRKTCAQLKSFEVHISTGSARSMSTEELTNPVQSCKEAVPPEGGVEDMEANATAVAGNLLSCMNSEINFDLTIGNEKIEGLDSLKKGYSKGGLVSYVVAFAVKLKKDVKSLDFFPEEVTMATEQHRDFKSWYECKKAVPSLQRSHEDSAASLLACARGLLPAALSGDMSPLVQGIRTWEPRKLKEVLKTLAPQERGEVETGLKIQLKVETLVKCEAVGETLTKLEMEVDLDTTSDYIRNKVRDYLKFDRVTMDSSQVPDITIQLLDNKAIQLQDNKALQEVVERALQERQSALNLIARITFHCTCRDGTPAKGMDCIEHGAELCSECNSGFHKDSEARCVKNKCWCKNGTPAEGWFCPKSGAKLCSKCDSGFHKDSEARCVKNKCWCKNGTPAEGWFCPKPGAKLCSKCDRGFRKDTEARCVKNKCWCKNGTPAEGKDCPKPGAKLCSKCDRGFHQDSEARCVKNKCWCKNGTPAEDRDCPTHRERKCVSCNIGYELQAHYATCDEMEYEALLHAV